MNSVFSKQRIVRIYQFKGINSKHLVKGTSGFMLVFMADFPGHREFSP